MTPIKPDIRITNGDEPKACPECDATTCNTDGTCGECGAELGCNLDCATCREVPITTPPTVNLCRHCGALVLHGPTACESCANAIQSRRTPPCLVNPRVLSTLARWCLEVVGERRALTEYQRFGLMALVDDLVKSSRGSVCSGCYAVRVDCIDLGPGRRCCPECSHRARAIDEGGL